MVFRWRFWRGLLHRYFWTWFCRGWKIPTQLKWFCTTYFHHTMFAISNNDDVLTWKRFPHYWPFLKNIPPGADDSPDTGPVVHLKRCRTNRRVGGIWLYLDPHVTQTNMHTFDGWSNIFKNVWIWWFDIRCTFDRYHVNPHGFILFINP